jgi:hypothetical protein
LSTVLTVSGLHRTDHTDPGAALRGPIEFFWAWEVGVKTGARASPRTSPARASRRVAEAFVSPPEIKSRLLHSTRNYMMTPRRTRARRFGFFSTASQSFSSSLHTPVRKARLRSAEATLTLWCGRSIRCGTLRRPASPRCRRESARSRAPRTRRARCCAGGDSR